MSSRRNYKRDRLGRFARGASSQGKSRPKKAAIVGAHAYVGAQAYGSGHKVTAALHGAKIATVAGQSATRRLSKSYHGRHSEKIKSANAGLAKAEGYVDKALAASYGSIIGVKVAKKSITGISAAAAGRQVAKNGVFTGF